MSHLLRTPLYDWHCARNARMTCAADWEMPELYTSVAQEYEAVRNRIGVMDISHNGHFIFDGPGACQFLDSLLSRDISALRPGQIRFALLTNEKGGIIDDILVGFLHQKKAAPPCYHLYVNACNREKDLAYFKQFLIVENSKAAGRSVFFTDKTVDRGMISVQGPHALELLQPLFQTDISKIKYYSGAETLLWSERPVFISRTGYSGRDGFEIMLESFFMEQFVELLFEAGRPFGITPIGLATRDVLRQEAGIPRYGNELDEEVTPFEAKLEFAVHLDSSGFPGKKVLSEYQMKTPPIIRIGLEIADSKVAEKGDAIFVNRQKIGRITSGTFLPSRQKSIAMGYVLPEFSQIGQSLSVESNGKNWNAAVVPMPFL